MNGASLSRWTLSYFASGLAALLVGEILLVAGFGFPSHALDSPQTLVLVHLVAVGWLSLLMCGALIQFVPVLVAKPLAHPDLPAIALPLTIAGLASVILGFLGMAGAGFGPSPWLQLGGIGLACGFALNIWNLGRTMWTARPIGLAARFVALGLASLAGVIALGLVFSSTIGGWSANDVVVRLTSQAIPIHAALGLGGWLTVTAVGVSYRLLAMFMLAPEAERRTSAVALYAGGAAFLILLVGGPVCILVLNRDPTHPLAAALVLATLSLTCYGYDAVGLYRARKRKKLELNTRMAAWALGCLGLGLLLTLLATASGEINRSIGALTFLFAFGWLTGLGLAKLYKIIAFVTWLECYGPSLGRRPTPRVQDLVDEGRVLPWFLLYFLSVAVASAAAFFGAPFVFRAAAAAMLAATGRICVEFVRIRTLRFVSKPLLPQDAGAWPRLLLTKLQPLKS
ncbi:hypothetical protein [Rhodoblastus sp.]|jgi:hypothetical protein|uniref:hypothetical protein n=1 Tax=Rhodoblastus sp. TaxID=1962975 RepID=UPI0025F19662|nr:hypothetical protein [Rhodoblastus sp.]